MENYLVYLRQLNFSSMVLRVLFALATGGLIGFERERKGRPAGFRTYMLVAMGAALTVILGEYLCLMIDTVWAEDAEALGVHTDVFRLGAQVINGVGFLGAGTIIVTGRQEVKGLTTAAGLWAAACMGLAIGAGFYECMLAGVLLILLSMNVLPFIEYSVLARSRNINIYVEMDNIESLGGIVNKVKSNGIKLHDADISKDQHNSFSQVNALFSMELPRRQPHAEILAMLSTCEGIISIEEM